MPMCQKWALPSWTMRTLIATSDGSSEPNANINYLSPRSLKTNLANLIPNSSSFCDQVSYRTIALGRIIPWRHLSPQSEFHNPCWLTLVIELNTDNAPFPYHSVTNLQLCSLTRYSNRSQSIGKLSQVSTRPAKKELAFRDDYTFEWQNPWLYS